MESESKVELPNCVFFFFLVFFYQPEAGGWGGYVNLMMEKKGKRKEHPSWQSFNVLGIGYYLGRNPLQQNHTHSQWRLGLRSSPRSQGCS